MTQGPGLHPLRWLPPFVVGVSLATAGEIAVGLLLYAGPGLMRSLTLILAVEAAAMGVGLATAPGHHPDLIGSLRRRWLFCLVTFLVATVFAASWSLLEGVGGTRLTQGLGLGFLAALPLYGCGGVLGAMATAAATEPKGRVSNVGGPAALGAALGFVATGISLPQVLTPASLLLVCLVLLSAGGLVYGSVLDGRLRVVVRVRRPSVAGAVRVEDRHLPLRDRGARLLFEGACLRRWKPLEGGDAVPWDLAVAGDWLPAPEEAPLRVLLVGGGASSFPRMAIRAHPSLSVDVIEANPEVIELAADHLATGLARGSTGRVRLQVGNMIDLVARSAPPYDLVLLDSQALCPAGGLRSLSRQDWAALTAAVAPGGVMALGPLGPGVDEVAVPEGWWSAAWRRELPESLHGLGDRREAAAWPSETVVVLARTEPAHLTRAPEFEPVRLAGVGDDAPSAASPPATGESAADAATDVEAATVSGGPHAEGGDGTSDGRAP